MKREKVENRKKKQAVLSKSVDLYVVPRSSNVC